MRLLSLPAAIVAVMLALAAAGCGDNAQSPEDFGTRKLILPGGQTLRVEVMYAATDLQRGMKYRDSLPEGRGMLFIHGIPGKYPYWMFEVKVPLDIIWLDRNKRIVQLIHEVPPCPGPEKTCKYYGGQFDAQFVLEIPAGAARKYGLHPGMVLDF